MCNEDVLINVRLNTHVYGKCINYFMYQIQIINTSSKSRSQMWIRGHGFDYVEKQVVDQYWSKVCGVIFEITR